MSKTIAYLRVSTGAGDNDKNKAAILEFAMDHGLKKPAFIEEKVSGMKSWNDRKIHGIINDLDDGDALIVSELSRLGRSMLEIMEIISVAIRKGIRVYALKGNWELDGTIQSKIVAMVFSMAAEIEHDLIVARTKESLAAAKAKGVKLGRPKGPGKSRLDKYEPEIRALLANGSTQKFIANRYCVTAATLSNWLVKNSNS